MKLNQKSKKIIAILVTIAFVAIISGVTYQNLTKRREPTKKSKEVAISKTLRKDKTYKSLTFSDIKAEKNQDLNHITIYIHNNSNETFEQEFVKIIFQQEDNGIIDEVEVIIPEIEAQGNSILDIVVSEEVLKAHTFIIEK